jgi:RNA polymerase sigma-70 factor (ECF subfamily)
MNEDHDLIDEYLSGDKEAFGRLVTKYQKRVYAMMYRVVGEVEGARDLTQETFVRAVKSLKRFRREASFKTWLYQIAINAGRSHLRRKGHQKAELDEATGTGPAMALSAVMEEERKSLLRKGLAVLPLRQKAAIILRAYEGLSCRETAKIMGCSEGAVKAHYHQAVKRLREAMAESGYGIEP